MKILGMCRARNEARWIERCLLSLFPLCEHVFVLDDHSTDDTAAICQRIEGVTVFLSPFTGLDEARDKTWLLGQIPKCDAVLCIDGDEELIREDQAMIANACASGNCDAWSMRILYLWDREDQVRIDGVYGRFRRPSLFRWKAGAQFRATGHGGNFHCSSVPTSVRRIGACEARLLHYGYLHRVDRLRKWSWYNEHDPNNAVENFYQHCIQGDVPEIPASARLKWAGPLELRSIGVRA